MIQPVVIFFVVFASLFATVHWFAIEASLYWHYWWFDILMHFWGGILIAFGVVSLTTFRRITLKPTLKLVLLTSMVIVILWEFFEWKVGLMDFNIDSVDALQDMFLGIFGGLLGYVALKRFKI